jgi:hypothetical protein
MQSQPANHPSKAYPAPNYRRLGLDIYPHPYFDPSNWYTPTTVKEMFRWCLFLYITNSTIGPVIRKKAAYIITDLIYSTTSERTKTVWKDLLETVLKIREFEFIMLIDFEVFGNAFVSIVYPFDRYLVCPRCEYENLLKSIKWHYDGANFVGKCKNCQTRAGMKVKDKPVRNRKRISLHRWFPQYIEPKRNPITGKTRYILRIPAWIKKKIKDPRINKVYVEDTPVEFLEAIKRNKVIELDPDNLYHMKHETVSMEDDSFGVPQLLNVIKDAWLLQTFKKGQEAIALEHILPLTLVSPMPSPATPSPHMGTDLGTWRGKMQNIFSQWRRDPNALFPVPFPVQVSQVRGDAQALSLHNDLNQQRQNIAGGLDVPPDFLYGNLTWSGGNVTLRVLENLLINRLSTVNGFQKDWLQPRLRRFFMLPRCEIRHKDFKMADDIQQKNIALQLRASNTISDQTVVEELGFDVSREESRKEKEMDKRLADTRKQRIADAEVNAKINIIMVENELEIAKIRAEAQQVEIDAAAARGELPPGQANMQTAPGAQPNQPQQPGRPGGNGQTGGNGRQEPMQILGGQDQPMPSPSPLALQTMVNNFIKSTPVHEQEYQLNILAQDDPVLARAIKDHLTMLQRGQAEVMKPQPEQKPPRRSPETAAI